MHVDICVFLALPMGCRKDEELKYIRICGELDKKDTYQRVALDLSFHMSYTLFEFVGLFSSYCHILLITSIRNSCRCLNQCQYSELCELVSM